jgi:hypothetical protein
MNPSEMIKRSQSLRTDRDRRIIDSVAVSLVEVGKDDGVERLLAAVMKGESEDKLHTACEIAIAWIRFAQDLKEELRVKEAAGYL